MQYSQNNFTINVVEPSPDVPGTGLFSAGVNNTGSIITIIASMVILSILTFIIFRLFKKHKNILKSHNFKRQFKNLFAKRSFIMTMSLLTLVAFGATFMTLKNFDPNAVNAAINIIGELNVDPDDTLSVSAEDIYMTTELDDAAVYLEAETKVRVNTPTTLGYTLYMAAMNPDINQQDIYDGVIDGSVNNTLYLNGDTTESHKISALSSSDVLEGLITSGPLEANTWGFSMTNPADQTSTVFRGVPGYFVQPIVPLKVTNEITPENDETTVYFGAYLTPDLITSDGAGYGEYKGAEIVYAAVAHPDVSNEDIIVNYHGNGLKFPNGSDTNTVVYGNECDMAYIGTSCKTVYEDTEVAGEVTLDEIKSMGIKDDRYYVYSVTIPDTDYLQLDIDHNLENHNNILLVSDEVNADSYAKVLLYGNYDTITYADNNPRPVILAGGTVTLIYFESETSNDSLDIKIHRVYAEKPANIATIATSFCKTIKTPNIANNGEQMGMFTGALGINSVSIPGADGLLIDLEYAFTGTSTDIDDGFIVYSGSLEGINSGDSYEIFSVTARKNQHKSGRTVLTIEGSSVASFAMMGAAADLESSYGFYARVYPIYNNEQDCTTPVENCSFKIKSGSYINPDGYKGAWEALGDYYETKNGENIRYLLSENSTQLAGTELDVYAYNPYAIIYDGNDADDGTMDGFYNDITNDDQLGNYEQQLIAPNFKKDGYGFAGWSLKPNAEVNNPNFDGLIYGPNQTVTQDDIGNISFIADGGKSAKLYAVWTKADENQTMQTFSCDTLSQGEIIALKDERDNNVYTVAKLADGNCWMMENLRLDNTATITAENTDNPALEFALGIHRDRWCHDDNEEICINQSELNTNNINVDGISDSGEPLTPHYDDDEVEFGITQWYSYGNYYNWYSATAGTGTYSVGESGKEDAVGSICPRGWNLPISDDTRDANDNFRDKSFAKLGENLNNVASWRAFPNNFVLSGHYYNDHINFTNDNGYYQSRTALDNRTAGALELSTSSVYTEASSNSKINGAAIRCVHE